MRRTSSLNPCQISADSFVILIFWIVFFTLDAKAAKFQKLIVVTLTSSFRISNLAQKIDAKIKKQIVTSQKTSKENSEAPAVDKSTYPIYKTGDKNGGNGQGAVHALDS